MKLAHIAIALCLCGLPGCGSGPDRPERSPVSGVVKMDGKALADVSVVFRPAEGTKGLQVARGQTDAEGRYSLTTWEEGDGAIPGDYVVTFAKVDTSSVGQQEMDLNDPSAQYAEMTQSASEMQSETAEGGLPAIYSDPSQTPEKHKVATEANQIDFELSTGD